LWHSLSVYVSLTDFSAPKCSQNRRMFYLIKSMTEWEFFFVCCCRVSLISCYLLLWKYSFGKIVSSNLSQVTLTPFILLYHMYLRNLVSHPITLHYAIVKIQELPPKCSCPHEALLVSETVAMHLNSVFFFCNHQQKCLCDEMRCGTKMYHMCTSC